MRNNFLINDFELRWVLNTSEKWPHPLSSAVRNHTWPRMGRGIEKVTIFEIVQKHYKFPCHRKRTQRITGWQKKIWQCTHMCKLVSRLPTSIFWTELVTYEKARSSWILIRLRHMFISWELQWWRIKKRRNESKKK